MRFPTKIPTLIGLFLVIPVVASAILIFENISRLPIVASSSITPKKIQVTNLSDNTATITWETDDPATGVISLKNQKGQQVFYDERDATGNLNKYQTHSVTARNLTTMTNYTYEILSNGKKFSEAKGEINTGSVILNETISREPAYGQAVFENSNGENLPAAGAIVYLTLEGSQTLSSLVKPSGSWVIPLNLIRTHENNEYLPSVDERITENIRVSFNGLESLITTDTLNDAPVPVVTVGKNYDFRKIQAAINNNLAANLNTTVLGTQTEQLATNFVDLTIPAQDAFLNTTFPFIQGTGIPGKIVTITLGINSPQSNTTTVNSDGTWNFTPTKPLSPGKQMVTITSMDLSNKPVAITHLFTIFKSGTQVLGDATPSATLMPSPTSIIIEPTSTSAGEPLPISGSSLPTIILLIISSALLLSGTAFAFIK